MSIQTRLRELELASSRRPDRTASIARCRRTPTLSAIFLGQMGLPRSGTTARGMEDFGRMRLRSLPAEAS